VYEGGPRRPPFLLLCEVKVGRACENLKASSWIPERGVNRWSQSRDSQGCVFDLLLKDFQALTITLKIKNLEVGNLLARATPLRLNGSVLEMKSGSDSVNVTIASRSAFYP
jgi:hypothetical protein